MESNQRDKGRSIANEAGSLSQEDRITSTLTLRRSERANKGLLNHQDPAETKRRAL